MKTPVERGEMSDRELEIEIAKTFFDWKFNRIKGDESYYSDEVKKNGGFWLQGVCSIDTTNQDGSPRCPEYTKRLDMAFVVADIVKLFEGRYLTKTQGGWDITDCTFGEPLVFDVPSPGRAICLAALKLENLK